MNYFLINICVVILLLILIFYRYRSYVKKTNECLKQQGWTLYLLESCPHCKTQLQDLATFKSYVIFKNTKNAENAENAEDTNIIIKNYGNQGKLKNFTNIKAFPYWFNTKTGKELLGVQDLKKIIDIENTNLSR